MDRINFQTHIIEMQLAFQKQYKKIARDLPNDRKIIISDRTGLDSKSFMPADDWAGLLAAKRWTENYIINDFSAVLFMETAAKGAAEHYTLANNAARTESEAEAIASDDRLQAVYVGVEKLLIIKSCPNFEDKLKDLLKKTQKLLGIPVALETERKFLVKNSVVISNIPVPYNNVHIEQHYLISPDDNQEFRIRKRTQGGGSTYHHATKKETSSAMSREEKECRISWRDYENYLLLQRPGAKPIIKIRTCFIYKGQYFELDTFLEPEKHRGLTLLEIELTEENDKVEIPDWLGPIEEVTGNKKYNNSYLAFN